MVPRKRQLEPEAAIAADPSIIKLYRGDTTSIMRFMFNRCSAGSYLGQGVYLTDDHAIATTYRTKDYHGQQYWSEGLAKSNNINSAMNIAFNNFVQLVDLSGNINSMPINLREMFRVQYDYRLTKIDKELAGIKGDIIKWDLEDDNDQDETIYFDGTYIVIDKKLFNSITKMRTALAKELWQIIKPQLDIRRKTKKKPPRYNIHPVKFIKKVNLS